MSGSRSTSGADTSGTVRVSVTLTLAEAAALRDGAFTCTSSETHKAGRRALDKFRSAVAAAHPRPPLG
jgi:hypothetical protein